MSTPLSPKQLLQAARALVFANNGGRGMDGVRPRASAVLARQALESQIVVALAGRIPGIESCSLRAQLICLQTYFEDKALAGEVAHAWWGLTGACHHRLYELAPSVTELIAWVGVVDRFVRHGDGSDP